MYPNFRAERARAGLTIEAMSEKLGVSISTLSLKLNGKSPITLTEAANLKKILKSELPLEILFATEADK